jgi:hypothetical protein
VRKTFNIIVKITTKIIGFTPLSIVLSEIPLIKTSKTTDAPSKAKQKMFFDVKIATIYSKVIISLLLGSSLCMGEFPGKN